MKYFTGIDPGFSGAIVTIGLDGSIQNMHDLPVINEGKEREFNLEELDKYIYELSTFTDLSVGLEHPTTRPGEGAERSRRFGYGQGLLEALLFVRHISYARIAPNLWKGRLGLPGKEHTGAVKQSADVCDWYYPDATDLIRGPRGGLLDGRIDALLIAHFLRLGTVGGLQSIVQQFGKGSAQAMSILLGHGQRGRKNIGA